MNTPTPAQALGECLRLSGGAIYGPWETGGESDPLAILSSVTYVQIAEFNPAHLLGITNAAFACTAVNFIRQHGQHFAGLERELERLRSIAGDQGGAFLRLQEENATLRAKSEAAEARCAELEERNEYLANELQLARSHVTGWKLRCQQWQEQAESDRARAREAEGLLRHWQAWICGPSELHKATATFIAANGETKVTTHPEQAARDMLERMGFEDAQGMTAGDVDALANLIANSRRYEARCAEACAMAWRICNFSDSEMRDGDAAREECAAFLAANGESK